MAAPTGPMCSAIPSGRACCRAPLASPMAPRACSRRTTASGRRRPSDVAGAYDAVRGGTTSRCRRRADCQGSQAEGAWPRGFSEVHPEWANITLRGGHEAYPPPIRAFTAGVPGRVRVIYLPPRWYRFIGTDPGTRAGGRVSYEATLRGPGELQRYPLDPSKAAAKDNGRVRHCPTCTIGWCCPRPSGADGCAAVAAPDGQHIAAPRAQSHQHFTTVRSAPERALRLRQLERRTESGHLIISTSRPAPCGSRCVPNELRPPIRVSTRRQGAILIHRASTIPSRLCREDSSGRGRPTALAWRDRRCAKRGPSFGVRIGSAWARLRHHATHGPATRSSLPAATQRFDSRSLAGRAPPAGYFRPRIPSTFRLDQLTARLDLRKHGSFLAVTDRRLSFCGQNGASHRLRLDTLAAESAAHSERPRTALIAATAPTNTGRCATVANGPGARASRRWEF